MRLLKAVPPLLISEAPPPPLAYALNAAVPAPPPFQPPTPAAEEVPSAPLPPTNTYSTSPGVTLKVVVTLPPLELVVYSAPVLNGIPPPAPCTSTFILVTPTGTV